MFHITKRKTLIAFVIYFLLSLAKVSACDCPKISIEDDFEMSTMIFSGKVTGFEYRKNIPNQIRESQTDISSNQADYETMVVKFQVEQWWKGEAPPIVFLITNQLKYADGSGRYRSCDFRFYENESYLIYASGNKDELRTSICRRTKILTKAGEDLRSLGDGKKPIEN